MMPAAKHFDPLLGIDIHFVQPPGAVPPIPIPHPYIGLVFDPLDYVPVLGATVFVGGLPRAQAGSSGISLPPHFPMGGTFLKPPANESEIFMGSSTVSVDGDAFSHLALPVLSCQDIGLPPIPRRKKKKVVKSLVLPLTMVLSIPVPVLVGGPPTISLMALAMRAGMAAGAKALRGLVAKAKKMRKARRVRKAQNGLSANGGHPVDIITGAQFDTFLDAKAPGEALFCWRRHYTTARAHLEGPLGFGFRHAYQHSLQVEPQACRYEDERGREYLFPPLSTDGQEEQSQGLVLRRLDAHRYELRNGSQPRLIFELPQEGGEALLTRVSQAARSLELHYAGGRLTGLTEHASGGEEARYEVISGHHGRISELRQVTPSGPRLLAVYTYDSQGCMTASVHAEGGQHQYEYDARRLMTRMRDPRGYEFWWKYDAQGRCIETAGEDGLWRTRLEYAPGQRETRVIKRQGGLWLYRYDENATLRERVDPYGGRFRRQVDEDGRVLRELDYAGRPLSWLYDENGAHVGRRDYHGFVFPPEELLPILPDPLELRPPQTPLEQQWKGVVEAPPPGAASPLGPITPLLPANVMRAALAVLSPRRAAGAAAPLPHREFDGLGHQVAERDAAGRLRRWRYDGSGNLVDFEDADGRHLTLRMTSWNLVGARVDALGHSTSYTYNSTEQVVRVVDPGGAITEYGYDEKDRLIAVHRDGEPLEAYLYNVRDQLIEKRDSAGQLLLRLRYDERGDVIERQLTSGEVHRFEYDGWGRPTLASTKAHEVRLLADPRGRPVRDLRAGRGVEHWYVADRPIQTRFFERFLVEYRRELSAGALTLVDPTGGEHILRTAEPGLVLREHANGTRELLEYNGQGLCEGRLSWRVAGDGSVQTSATRYRYSAEGDLLECICTQEGRVVYEVDAAHRLVAELRPDGRREYRLDAAGNVLEKPGLSRVELEAGNRLRAANDEVFTYNSRQHISERRSAGGRCVRYTYDSLDQLIQVEDGQGEPWTADYDGLGRRIRCGRGQEQTGFFWDGNRLAAELAPDGRLRLYLYADTEAIVPLLFVDYASADAPAAEGRVYTLLTNHQGMPLQVEDAQGQWVWRAERVDPYGQLEVHPASRLTLNLRWPGHYFDAETGLHYNRFRYYDPQLGRYIQGDPLGLAGGINVYAAPANPVSLVDVLGWMHPGQGSDNSAGSNTAAQQRAKTNSGIKTGHVDSYKEQNRIAKTGDKIDHDHIPAFASVRDRINAQRIKDGLDVLEDAEEKLLKKSLTSMAVDHDVHKIGRTYGNRGGAARRAEDASDLRKATEEDLAVHRPNLLAQGHTAEKIDEWETAVIQRNEAIGLYDDDIPSSLWEIAD
jgi:RHS repeat-associated protein